MSTRTTSNDAFSFLGEPASSPKVAAFLSGRGLGGPEQNSSVPEQAPLAYVDKHRAPPARQQDRFYTDNAGRVFIVDHVTKVPMEVPQLKRDIVNAVLHNELVQIDPRTHKSNLETSIANLVQLSHGDGMVALNAVNTILDRLLGKPVQETKSTNVNASTTLDDLLNTMQNHVPSSPMPVTPATRPFDVVQTNADPVGQVDDPVGQVDDLDETGGQG